MLAFCRALPQKLRPPQDQEPRMPDFAAARRMMVDGQVRTADVTDLRLLAAMQDLPRERFFPADKAALAYLDLDAVVSAPGQPVRRLLKPMVLAKLIQTAAIAGSDRVLDVGCGTGYSTVLLGHLAGSVVGLEEDASLARQAADALTAAGLASGKIVTGALANGCAGEGPYDVIVLEGSAEVVPPALFAQLKSGGRLVGVLGRGPASKAMIYRRTDGDLSGRTVFDAAAAPLPGFAKPPEFVF
jgi:protein-L-isoaspartate(D-aspartate) O-methyltransferase